MPHETDPRYAYQMMTGAIGRPGDPTWRKSKLQLGELGDEGGDIIEEDCAWWDLLCQQGQGGDPVIPGEIPGLELPGIPGGETGGGGNLPTGVVTEQQCKAREAAAYQQGQTAERSNLITTTVITGVVSALVGAGISYVLR